jgi:nucleoside 2-deoxyribosyltransferase
LIKAYICGPYRADTYEGIEANIQAAQAVARELVKMGYNHFCPHANTAHFDGLQPDEFFLQATMEWLECCDIVVALPNYLQSAGSVAEIKRALQLGKKIFVWPYNERELRMYGKSKEE